MKLKYNKSYNNCKGFVIGAFSNAFTQIGNNFEYSKKQLLTEFKFCLKQHKFLNFMI
jgi:hypothetical protein